MSKDTVVRHAIRFLWEKSMMLEMPSMKLNSPSRVTSTPLGIPVEPEVKRI